MTEEQRVDPRYDPAFQRGFQGSVTSGPRRRPAPQNDALVTPAPFRTADPAPAGPAAADPAASVPASAVEARQAHDDAVPESGQEDPGATSAAAGRRLSRNPYLIAVTVLGAALVAGGAAWGNQARSLVSGRAGAATDLDYWYLQATIVGAPLTIVAGIGILAGVLFFAAAAWRRS